MTHSQYSAQSTSPLSPPAVLTALPKVYVLIVNKAVLVASHIRTSEGITSMVPERVALSACDELGLHIGGLRPLLMHGPSGVLVESG